MTPKEASRKENDNKGGEIYIQNLVVRPLLQHFLIKVTLKGGRKRFLKFQTFN